MAANQVDQRSDKKAEAFDVEGQAQEKGQEIKVVDYARRARWLGAAAMGFSEGLPPMASLVIMIMGDGAAKMNFETMIRTAVVGACIMAVIELVSVYSQCDINMAQMKGQGRTENMEAEMEKSRNPWQEAGASALAFAVGAFVPLLGAAFVKGYGTTVRVGVVIGVVSFALFGFGGLCAVLGKAPVMKSCLRMLVGGWLVMGLTFAKP